MKTHLSITAAKDLAAYVTANNASFVHYDPKGMAQIAVDNYFRVHDHRDELDVMLNSGSNTIDPVLQRTVLLFDALEAYAIPLVPLQAFSVVHQNIPLEGTDIVAVPYYPLQTDAAQSWDPSAGYSTNAGSTTQSKSVSVGGSGVASGSSAAAGTAKDRKYMSLAFDSYTLRRQPFFNTQKLVRQKANKLAVDIFTDIVSRVITAATYGASVKPVPASAFSADDLAELWQTGTARNWPVTDRALVLDATYKTPLLKDQSFKYVYASGSDETIRRAAITDAYGFTNLHFVPNLASYLPAGENCVGWINHLYGALVATAPILPSPEVMRLLPAFQIVTDPKTGISFTYRAQGNAILDSAQHLVEAC